MARNALERIRSVRASPDQANRRPYKNKDSRLNIYVITQTEEHT